MNSQHPLRHLFWQIAMSIVLGVATGLAILALSDRPAAQALVKSTFPRLAHAVAPSNTIQIFPTLSERMNVLVMGVDSNGRETERITGTRSDTMILVSLDPEAHKVGMVSIPRDSRVKISGNHGLDKINAAHAFGGAPLAVQTISENFSVPIDHFVVVDTQALKELCQLLGPVEVLVEKEMKYHDWAAHLHIDLKPGLQVLSPEQVEQYVRFRHDPRGDIGRIERQQWFFRSAGKKLKDPQFLLRLPELIRLAHEYVQTDLSLEDMARLATFGKDIRPENIVTATVPGAAEMIAGGSYWIPDMDASRIVFNRILGLAGGGAFVEDAAAVAPASATNSTQLVSNTSASVLKPLSVALKYPKGKEAQAEQLERLLTLQGYRVRYKWLVPGADCQHEQIIQLSARADDFATEKMREQLPDLNYWPVVLALEGHPVADFIVVISPDVNLAAAEGAAVSPTVRAVLPN